MNNDETKEPLKDDIQEPNDPEELDQAGTSKSFGFFDELIEKSKDDIRKSARRSAEAAKLNIINFFMEDFSKCAAVTALRMSAINSACIAASMDPSLSVKEEADKILEGIFADWKTRADSVFEVSKRANKPEIGALSEMLGMNGMMKDLKSEYDKATEAAKQSAETRIRSSLALTPSVEDLNSFFDLGDDNDDLED